MNRYLVSQHLLPVQSPYSQLPKGLCFLYTVGTLLPTTLTSSA